MESNKKTSVIFLCTHNSSRSQIAEGYLREKSYNIYEVHSAGTEPSQVNPYTITVMEEIGIVISHHTTKNVTQFLGMKIDLVVTVCDNVKENCPFFPGGREFIHKEIQDPSSIKGTEYEKLHIFRKVRDEIISWIDSEFL